MDTPAGYPLYLGRRCGISLSPSFFTSLSLSPNSSDTPGYTSSLSLSISLYLFLSLFSPYFHFCIFLLIFASLSIYVSLSISSLSLSFSLFFSLSHTHIYTRISLPFVSLYLYLLRAFSPFSPSICHPLSAFSLFSESPSFYSY